MALFEALVLGLFFGGYFVLAGADLGLGMLLPYLGRTRAEWQLTARAMQPLALSGEAFLILGATMAVVWFPGVVNRVFSELWFVVVPLLLGLVLRDMGRLWWQTLGGGSVCGVLVCTGSWTEVGSWGWGLASLMGASPGHHVSAVQCALTAAVFSVLFLSHGLGFAALRLSGSTAQRARLLTGRAAGRSFALTSSVMAALPPLAGSRLAVTGDPAEGPRGLLPPALFAFASLLPAVRVWLRRTLGGPGSEHPRDPSPSAPSDR